MVQEIRSLQKLAIFFRVSRWGRRGGGGLYAVLYGTYISMESAVFTKTTTIFNTKQLFFVQLNQDLRI